jgi:hypothetical protein
MFLDADDWMDIGLVEAARAVIDPDQIGAVIEAGIVTDFQSLRAAPVPPFTAFVARAPSPGCGWMHLIRSVATHGRCSIRTTSGSRSRAGRAPGWPAFDGLPRFAGYDRPLSSE